MVTEIKNPDCVLIAAYAPINFSFTETVSNSVTLYSSIEVEVYIENNLSAVLPFSPRSSIENNPNEGINTFEIDVSGVIQKSFANDNSMPDVAINGFNSILPTRIKAFRIEVYSWVPSAEGKLVREQTPFVSANYESINAALDVEEDQCLTDYTKDVGRLFLTNRVVKREICFDDLEYLSIIRTANSFYRITTYDDNGNQIEQGDLGATNDNDSNTIGLTKDVHTLGVSPKQINDQVAWINSSVTIDDSVKYYTIQFYSLLGTPISEVRTFYIRKSCCSEFEIFFLNKFGEFDNVNIKAIEEDQYEINSVLFTEPMGNLRGRSKLYAESIPTFNIRIPQPSRQEFNWLEELSRTPNAFIYKNNELRPIIIRDSSQIYEGKFSPNVTNVNLLAEYSNKKYSQRN